MLVFALILAIFLSISGVAAAQVGPFAYAEQCGRPEIQAPCIATCARGCQERTFFKQNTNFCLSGDYDRGIPSGLADAADCPLKTGPGKSGKRSSKFEDCTQYSKITDRVACEQRDRKPTMSAPAEPTRRSMESKDCTQYSKITERVACEERDRKPKCAANTPELLDRANLLVSSVDRELGQYGELLTLDFSKIDNRDKLCSYSSANLDKFYEIATKNPDTLNALQAEAAGIQRCQAEYEKYISPVPEQERKVQRSNTGSDVLPENIVNAVRADLKILQPTMMRLTRSVETLKDAANRIYQIARLHGTACRSQGTPVPKK